MKKPEISRRAASALQNIGILCLSMTAMLLLILVISYESDGSGAISSLNNLLSAPSGGEGAQSEDLGGMAAPCNLVATSEQGRYGRMLVSAAESDRLHASSLMLEALGSAGNGSAVTEDQFRAALEETGLFLDYLFPIPASVLAGWFGADYAAGGSIRYVLIAGGEDTARLYLWDGAGAIISSSTAVESAALEEFVLSFSADLGDVAFAFEDPETYGHLAPYTVLSSEAGETKALSSSLPALAADVDTLLDMLDFNPHTIARYNLANGIEVVEYPRTLRVYSDGVVQYSGDKDTASALYVIPAGEDGPTQAEAVLAARRLAEILLPEAILQGADFYFTGIQSAGEGYSITFDYLVDGIPVYLPGGPALEVQTSGAAITSFRIQYRQYAAQEETYHLLPLAQTVNIAAGTQGAFLTRGYVDRGGERVRAEWLLR